MLICNIGGLIVLRHEHREYQDGVLELRDLIGVFHDSIPKMAET